MKALNINHCYVKSYCEIIWKIPEIAMKYNRKNLNILLREVLCMGFEYFKPVSYTDRSFLFHGFGFIVAVWVFCFVCGGCCWLVCLFSSCFYLFVLIFLSVLLVGLFQIDTGDTKKPPGCSPRQLVLVWAMDHVTCRGLQLFYDSVEHCRDRRGIIIVNIDHATLTTLCLCLCDGGLV